MLYFNFYRGANAPEVLLWQIRPSACLSVKRMNCDKTKELSATLLYRMKGPFIQFFITNNGWWRRSPYTRNLGPK